VLVLVLLLLLKLLGSATTAATAAAATTAATTGIGGIVSGYTVLHRCYYCCPEVEVVHSGQCILQILVVYMLFFSVGLILFITADFIFTTFRSPFVF